MRPQRDFFSRRTLKVAKELLGKYLVRKYKGKLVVGKIVETEAYIGPKDKASHAYSAKGQSDKEKLKVIEENWERIKNYVDDKEKFIQRILRLKKAKVTKRNLAEYLRGGHIYIYLVYGNYYQLNITTYKEGYPECVLIRALKPITTDQHGFIHGSTRIDALINTDINRSKSKKHRFDYYQCESVCNQCKSVLNVGLHLSPNGPGKLCHFLYLDSSFWGYDLVNGDKIWLENGENYKESQIMKTTRIGIEYAKEDALLLWRFYVKNNRWVSKF